LFGFILAFLAAIISNYNQIGYHSGTNPANACINNLRQIDAAKNEWALENGKSNGVIVTENNIKSYIKLDSSGNIPKNVRQAALIQSEKLARNQRVRLVARFTHCHNAIHSIGCFFKPHSCPAIFSAKSGLFLK